MNFELTEEHDMTDGEQLSRRGPVAIEASQVSQYVQEQLADKAAARWEMNAFTIIKIETQNYNSKWR